MDSFSGRPGFGAKGAEGDPKPQMLKQGAGFAFCVLLAGSVTAPACSNGGGVVATDAGTDAPVMNDAMADAAFDAALDAAIDATMGADAAIEADAATDAEADGALPGTSEGCPSDMVLVAGNYCPNVQQNCIEHHTEFNNDQKKKKKAVERGEEKHATTVSERCLRYEEPSVFPPQDGVTDAFFVERY